MTKFVFHTNNGYVLHAGGLVLYDMAGIWLIKEFYKGGYKIIDPGGKYCFQDCTILNTICREFNEETYFAMPLDGAILQTVVDNNHGNFVYVCPDANGHPTYAALLLDSQAIVVPEDVQKKFHANRQEALKHNPHVPPQYYSSFDLIYINFSDIGKLFPEFHFRLKQICLNSFLKQYVKF